MTANHHARLRFVHAGPAVPEPAIDTLRAVVAAGLERSQKQLPCRFFYDAAGSQLFEQICELPEYYLTRSEESILGECAGEIVEAAGAGLQIVELGSGSSRKTRLLLAAALARQSSLEYVAIDISAEFLLQSVCALLAEHDALEVVAIAGEYADAIALVPEHERETLFLFLGSNIGNFEHADAVRFLRRIRARMAPRDRLLVGIDLVKDAGTLYAAYNDGAGITAAFNKNLLLRINRELGGRFDLNAFEHHAPYLEDRQRIEMRLVSRRDQCVPIAALDASYTFQQGEYIHTENSHKYTLGGFGDLCRGADLAVSESWLDSRGWFALLLLVPI